MPSLHSHVCPRADRDADVGGRECGGVVHPVPHHGDLVSLLLEFPYL